MKTLTLFLTITLIACGRDDGKTATPAPATPITNAEVPPTVPDAPQLLSVALNTVAELPACTVANETQLAYVIETAQFQVCRGGAWSVIEIAGKDGADGVAGANGKDGADGVDGAPVASNEWIDPIIGTVWVVGGSVPVTVNCGVGTRRPTAVEGLEAVANGVFTAFFSGSTPTTMWTSTGGAISANHTHVTPTGSHGNICIRES